MCPISLWFVSNLNRCSILEVEDMFESILQSCGSLFACCLPCSTLFFIFLIICNDIKKKREYKREIFLTDWLDDMWKIAIIEKEKQPRLNNVSSGHMSCWIAASAHPTEGKDVDYSGIFSLCLSQSIWLC